MLDSSRFLLTKTAEIRERAICPMHQPRIAGHNSAPFDHEDRPLGISSNA
jgi:hypothetical protein